MDFLTKEQADLFFSMLKAKETDVVHFALDMILNSDVYLPYRYNSQGEKRLKEELEMTTPDIRHIQRVWSRETGKLEGIPTEEFSKCLQKRLNRVRMKHTIPWDWRLIE